MVSDPRTVCGRGEGRATAAPGEEGAKAVQPPALRRARAARAKVAQSKGWGCPQRGGLPVGIASKTVSGVCNRIASGVCKQDREQGLRGATGARLALRASPG